MKIYIASHPEAGNVCAAQTAIELCGKLVNTFEYSSAYVDGSEIICLTDEPYDVIYTLTELEV